MKRILGLDLGTNSIGWALIEQDWNAKQGKVLGAGSRIIPMSQDILGKFDSGVSISQTAERTGFRATRRLRERHLLRRERLHRILNILGFLPKHYSEKIDFENYLGQFIPESEPKIAYSFNIETNKPEFIFKESFLEMMRQFGNVHPQLIENGKKIPYDWTIYYLRNKALTAKIEKEELAWLLLHFNQKRGYHQLRGEDEEQQPNKLEEFHSLKVIDVVATDEKKSSGETWYNVHLENGWIYRRTSKIPLDWVGKTKDLIAITELNDDGTIKKNKDGNEKRSLSIPPAGEWKLLKKKTEHDVEKSGKSIGTYIYDSLLKNPQQKIKGQLVRVVERKFYKQELLDILNKQKEFHNELHDTALYLACLEELYENNHSHKTNIAKKDFVHLFVNDIIFYQRPLKSKKSLISNCKFETRTFIKDGKKETQPVKCIAKSHPLFQEFRLWQFVQDVRIYEKGKFVDGNEPDVTNQFLSTQEDRLLLFEWLNDRKEIEQKTFLKYPAFGLKKNAANYRWNYVEDKSYPCNETRAMITSRLVKVQDAPSGFLNKENETALWHILYSVEDKMEIQKALKTFAEKRVTTSADDNSFVESFVENFKKFPTFKKEYSSYSAKAINKMLPLMRLGSYWSIAAIDEKTQGRIDKLLTGEFDESMKDRVRDKSIHLNKIEDFQGLAPWLVSYIVYDRHSEDGNAINWKKPSDIQPIPQHSLRNPIVEQVINETLKVVKDIWQHHGKGAENFFDEIHIELGREMKNTKNERERLSKQVSENENTNQRLKALLVELKNSGDVENVRPYSPMQQEILKIYEEGVLNAEEIIPEDILKITKQNQPTPSELMRYKLWLEQKYRSPYTGNIIPLTKLFTTAYEIEHVIPQSRYFDDSLSNKVICESEVNKDKDKMTAYQYIKNNEGKIVPLSFGKTATLFTLDRYEAFVRGYYAKNRGKMKKLLMDDIPEGFIQRQLNDTRYISKVVKNLMSNIVREDGELETTSKNVVSSSGGITAALRNDWGLNDVWNDLIAPRFDELNKKTGTTNFGEINPNTNKFLPQVPLSRQKGFSKKRIDHRHHALDAITIACASRSHINYLNNTSGLKKGSEEERKHKRYELQHSLCFKKPNDSNNNNYKWIFHKPWDTFTQDAKELLYSTVISFKQNVRVVNKTKNKYAVWKKDENGVPQKELIPQIKGMNWAIRKPMHKDTVSGLVQLQLKKHVSLSVAIDNWQMIVDKKLRYQIKTLVEQKFDKKKITAFFKGLENQWNGIDISRVQIFYWDRENVASRVNVDESFSSDKIGSITDSGIQTIMLNHLSIFNEVKAGKIIEHPELAFSADGLDTLNKNIVQLNNGKHHNPIYKVRTYEPRGNKFPVGHTGNKGSKYVEAAKGTNLFFAIYDSGAGKRSYESIPLDIVIERQKQGLTAVPETNIIGQPLLFHLSPNDLVYVPSAEEEENLKGISLEKLTSEQASRIYKVVSFSVKDCFFVRHTVAKTIVDKVEYGPLNKMERTLDGRCMVKANCLKLKHDRLGNIKLHTATL